jgi:hypothetical protein
MAVSIKKLPLSQTTQPRRRMGRGKLVFVRHWRINPRPRFVTSHKSDDSFSNQIQSGAEQ